MLFCNVNVFSTSKFIVPFSLFFFLIQSTFQTRGAAYLFLVWNLFGFQSHDSHQILTWKGIKVTQRKIGIKPKKNYSCTYDFHTELSKRHFLQQVTLPLPAKSQGFIYNWTEQRCQQKLKHDGSRTRNNESLIIINGTAITIKLCALDNSYQCGMKSTYHGIASPRWTCLYLDSIYFWFQNTVKKKNGKILIHLLITVQFSDV